MSTALPSIAGRRPLSTSRLVLLVRLPSRRLVIPGLLVLGLLAVAATGTGYSYAPLAVEPSGGGAGAAAPTATAAGLSKERKRLIATLQKSAPRGKYIVIDRVNNRLYVKEDRRVLIEAQCSAGSGMVLREEEGGQRTWVFDTPQGVFRVLNKVRNPVWKKPDWAFIEEGKPLPKRSSERIEYGTLGEYALHFGNGYMIHGTLYERLLGRNVTHGCIRLGRQDLRAVYQAAPIGTPIYVY